MSQAEYDPAYAERQLKRSQNPLRRLVKGLYLRNLLKDIVGPTVDFGCGAGQLLERLPDGSIGLEVNETLVSSLQKKGLDARIYNPENDRLLFKDLPEGQFTTLVMSHVLEHFDDAADGLGRVLDSSQRLGIKRVIIVVPGKKGYSFDDTHRTFVDRTYLEQTNIMKHAGFMASSFTHFPINQEFIGTYFTFHELKVIFDAT